MSKRLYLLILFAVTLFCGCKNSNPLDSTTKVSFSIPARVLEDVGNNNGEDILVCTQVLRGSKVIIDEKYERTLFFDENNKPCIESIVLENIPLYTSLVLKMQIFVGEELFAEGQSEKTLFTEGKNKLNLQLKLIPKDDDEDDNPEPEDPADPDSETKIELKIETTDISVTQGESATFIATEEFDSYFWECGNQSKSGTNIFTVDTTNLLSGKYIVKLIAIKDNNEYSAEAILVVEAKSGEVTSDITINQLEVKITAEINYENGKLILTATEGFINYIWEFMGEQILTETNQFVVNMREYQLQGSYVIRVIATDENGNEYSAEYIYYPEV